MEGNVEKKRAVVTGASSGIGASVAAGLAAAGARVCVNYVEGPGAAEGVVAGIRQVGGEALAVRADVPDAGQVRAMFARVDEAWGGVDVLVNNAGMLAQGAEIVFTFYWPKSDRWEETDFSVRVHEGSWAGMESMPGETAGKSGAS